MGGQGRCEQRSEVFVKIKSKKKINCGGSVWGGGGGGGVQVGGGGGQGVDGNEELKFL